MDQRITIDLLKPFNLDITKKDFWTQSISVVNNLIDVREYYLIMQELLCQLEHFLLKFFKRPNFNLTNSFSTHIIFIT